MASSAQVNEIENTVRPTPVEQGLVTAMVEQRDNWPAIYLEMTKVSRDDLLSDNEFCARYKHPSLTAFFVECGEIGGVKISLLRKYQRAGSYYESALKRFAALPPLTDEKVRNTPPDLFALVAKISHQLRKSGSTSVEVREQIEYHYLSSLLDRSISRKDLNQVYSLLNDEDSQLNANQAISNLIKSVTLKKTSVVSTKKLGSELEDAICGMLSNSDWLSHLSNAKVSKETISIPFSGASLFLGSVKKRLTGSVLPDLAVVENATGQLRGHAFEIKSSEGLENARTIHRLNNWVETSLDGSNGFDFIWVATDECDLEKGDLIDLGLDDRIGVLSLNGKALRIIRGPKLLETNAEVQLDFYKATTLLLSAYV